MDEQPTDRQWIAPLAPLTTTDGEVIAEGRAGYWKHFPTVFLVITEDRHHDVAVAVHQSQETAEREARGIAADRLPSPDRLSASMMVDLAKMSELTDDMRADGWTFTATYSVEGDAVRVQRASLIP